MKIPTQTELQNVMLNRVADWLTVECEKMWGKDFLKKGEKVDEKLMQNGYTVKQRSMGMTVVYELMKDDKLISHLTLNALTIGMEMAKRSTP